MANITISITQECLTGFKLRLLKKSMNLNKGLAFEDKLALGLLELLFEDKWTSRASA